MKTNNQQDFLSRYSLHETPFTREIAVKNRFVQENQDKQLGYLQRTIEKRMSATLIAPAGMGKTMLLRTLVDRLPETRYRAHYLKVTSLSNRDLCGEIATIVGVKKAGNYPTLVRRVQERFSSSFDTDSLKSVIIIDEAHLMRIDVLGILNILTNFDMDSRLVVSIILAGQPPLRQFLKQDTLEDVSKRMAHFGTLKLLSPSEINDYITHRCRIAGNHSSLFDKDALTAIHEIARGNLRATDYLCLKSLETAHDNDKDSVNANHVIEAREMLWP